MNGLLLKELYTVNIYKKNFLFMLGVMVVICVVMDMGTFYLPAMMMVYTMITSMSAYSVDESAKWDRYAIAMPVKRIQIVAARYLVTLFLTIVALLAAFVLGTIITLVRFPANSLVELALTCGIFALISMFAQSLMAPLCYKFGVEKARVAIMIIFMVPYLLIIWFMPYLMPFMQGLSTAATIFLGTGIILFICLLFIGSCVLSTRIYSKKEF
ncbi:ABC-2 transporter permease [Clostridia bacterium OttesenSCG-928-O13]|nr:ABC-2 transporter permease [Clostridia bacterium OttesenSCG-928-O13]